MKKIGEVSVLKLNKTFSYQGWEYSAEHLIAVLLKENHKEFISLYRYFDMNSYIMLTPSDIYPKDALRMKHMKMFYDRLQCEVKTKCFKRCHCQMDHLYSDGNSGNKYNLGTYSCNRLEATLARWGFPLIKTHTKQEYSDWDYYPVPGIWDSFEKYWSDRDK